MAVQQERIAQRTEPLYGQRDLRYLRDMLERMLAGRNVIKSLSRSLTKGELEFLARCESLYGLIREGYTGDLSLDRPHGARNNGKRPAPNHVQLRLEGDAA